MLIYLTISNIAMDLSKEEGDKWDRHAVKYEEKFNNFFSNMRVDYDKDNSGTITGDEEQEAPTAFVLSRRWNYQSVY